MKWLKNSILEIVLVLVCVYLSIRAPHFLETENLLKILVDASMQGVIALGMTMVIISGEIDLSVGSAVALTGCLMARMLSDLTGTHHWSEGGALCLAIPVVAVVGVATGCFTGFMRVRFRVPTFISTLAWMGILRGASGLITDGFKISLPEWISFAGAGYLSFSSDPETLWKIPVPALIFIGVFLLLQFVMNYTTFGRAIYAVGGNSEAARLSGINVGLVKVSVMAIVSALAVLAGILQAARIRAGDPKIGEGWELNVIASVIIGGTSLMGGAGRVWGTLIGIIFLGVLVNGMTQLNVSTYWQNIVRGILIFVAVLLNVYTPRARK